MSFAVYIVAVEDTTDTWEAVTSLPGLLAFETLEEDITEQEAIDLVEKVDATA
ncbi:MAG TPA: hypothetical protein VFX15_03190 [Actinomycetes bacterium]|nr:hypothetical protein [Actinomycetes bacterium]